MQKEQEEQDDSEGEEDGAEAGGDVGGREDRECGTEWGGRGGQSNRRHVENENIQAGEVPEGGGVYVAWVGQCGERGGGGGRCAGVSIGVRENMAVVGAGLKMSVNEWVVVVGWGGAVLRG